MSGWHVIPLPLAVCLPAATIYYHHFLAFKTQGNWDLKAKPPASY